MQLTVLVVHRVDQPVAMDAMKNNLHYCDVIMGAMASQTTSLTTVYSTFHSSINYKSAHPYCVNEAKGRLSAWIY